MQRIAGSVGVRPLRACAVRSVMRTHSLAVSVQAVWRCDEGCQCLETAPVLRGQEAAKETREASEGIKLWLPGRILWRARDCEMLRYSGVPPARTPHPNDAKGEWPLEVYFTDGRLCNGRCACPSLRTGACQKAPKHDDCLNHRSASVTEPLEQPCCSVRP